MPVLLSVLKYAVPLVLVSSLLEALVISVRRGADAYDWKAASLSMVDFLVREYPMHWLLALPLWVQAMDRLWLHRSWSLPMHHWSGWLACFLGQEFAFYWYHRTAHRVRVFWCTHAVHHSPNQLAFSAAYRTGWTGRIVGPLLFYLPAPLLGMPPRVVLTLYSINLLYQFWLHATWIPRLGPLEWILNTPSSHRVHHASNIEYLDGNYGGVLIVFDRLFGTYIQERQDTPCRFGLVKPMTTYNVLRVEFGHWLALLSDLRTVRSFGDAWRYVFKPPGWRPDGNSMTTEDLRRIASCSNLSGLSES